VRLVLAGWVWLLAMAPAAWAQSSPAQPLRDLLVQLNQASVGQSYRGTMVVSAGEHMMTAKIWHACSGEQQRERVENLNGLKRITWRHNDTVTTVWPNQARAVTRRFDDLGIFPAALQVPWHSVAQHYTVQPQPIRRVAGRQAQGVRLQATDAMRFSYNLLIDEQTGVVLKLQTVAPDGAVLEQTAYSDIAFDNVAAITQHARLPALANGTRLTVERSDPVDPSAMGWRMGQPVAGFHPLRAYRLARGQDGDAPWALAPDWQWLFSDGLASISLVIGQDANAAPSGNDLAEPVAVRQGATLSYARMVEGVRVTAVGEAPLPTLQAMVAALQRMAPNTTAEQPLK